MCPGLCKRRLRLTGNPIKGAGQGDTCLGRKSPSCLVIDARQNSLRHQKLVICPRQRSAGRIAQQSDLAALFPAGVGEPNGLPLPDREEAQTSFLFRYTGRQSKSLWRNVVVAMHTNNRKVLIGLTWWEQSRKYIDGRWIIHARRYQLQLATMHPTSSVEIGKQSFDDLALRFGFAWTTLLCARRKKDADRVVVNSRGLHVG